MKPHLFLNNPRGESKKFNVTRPMDDDDEDNRVPEKEARAYRRQKDTLNVNRADFIEKLEEKRQQRTLEIPEHIDYIQINFFPVFVNSADYPTKKRFERQFGLVPVSYSNFNQTVLLAISDENKFNHFLELLDQFITSDDNVHPNGKSYHILTLIHSFSFLTLKQNFTEDEIQTLVLGLISPAPAIEDKYSSIFTSLLAILDSNAGNETSITYKTDYQSCIEVKNISIELLIEIVRNFDIIQSVQSLRLPTIKQNIFNQPELTWNISIDPPANKNVIIGIIDNGVRRIAPLDKVIVDRRIDITNRRLPNPLLTSHPHGTMVATLAAIGNRFFDTTINNFTADAMIMPIKILDQGTSHLNIYDIIEAIERGIQAGVRIFNLSVCGPSKRYNEPHSDYALMLDRLAYENDILIFIATGNLDEDDINAMQAAIPDNGVANHFHIYPNHFYNPGELTLEHSCEATNLRIPSESMNNISVGAIADNLNVNENTSLTPFKELPAYYTRKWHIDYTRWINGRPIAKKQTNHNIRKPDIVMPGGDLLQETSRMHVISLGENAGDFYARESGTSLAAPLAANLGAQIIQQYPDFTMQTVKAIIINSSAHFQYGDLFTDLVNKVREETAQQFYQKSFANLTQSERLTISPHLSEERLYERIAGFGTPNLSKILLSDSKRVVVVIQDTISLNNHKVIKVKIPKYLLQYSKSGHILEIKGTLCYKFNPISNNQLGYNPLHISFNIFGDISRNLGSTAAIISDKQHHWYNKYIRGIEGDKEKSKAKNSALAIKTNPKPWSEDFFPTSSKPFSNTQQFDIKINTKEIKKVNNEITVAIRCTHKRDLPEYVEKDLSKQSHNFSIVLEICEKPNTELRNFDLYNELIAINDLDIYPIQILDLEADDLEADI